MKIRTITEIPNGLEVVWQDGEGSCFDYFWLRDNARDTESFNSASHQRELYTAGVARDIKPQEVILDADGTNLLVNWPELSDPVTYPADYLYQYREPATEYVYAHAQPWQTGDVDPRPLQFANLEEPGGVTHLLQEIAKLGFCLIQNCPLDPSSVTAVANKIGYVRETIFGGVWQFADNQEMADSAYSSSELRPHTDGTYSHDAPGIQLLLCLERNATGGDSVLVDGLTAAEQLRVNQPELFTEMCRIHLTGVYQGDGHLLRASRPMFRLDDRGRVIQVSFNNYDRDTVRLPEPDMKLAYDGIVAFDQLLNTRSNQWHYILAEGEMLVFDNWRLLHGRSQFAGQRRMSGAYVNREDFESKLREQRLLEAS